MLQLMDQKVPGLPQGDTVPPQKKFQKSSTPGQYTTSKFSNPPKIRGVHTLTYLTRKET